MARGGKRPGAGRPAGAANKRTREIADKLVSEGLSPLEYMLSVMRDEGADKERRDEMAKAAAPYVHPRLTAITAPDGKSPARLEVVWLGPSA